MQLCHSGGSSSCKRICPKFDIDYDVYFEVKKSVYKDIHDMPYGFRNEISTADLLISVTHRCSSSLQVHGESRIVALGISKSSACRLLHKLPCYSVPPKHCIWISSYLPNRWISMIVNGHSYSYYSWSLWSCPVFSTSALICAIFCVHSPLVFYSCQRTSDVWILDYTLLLSSFEEPLKYGMINVWDLWVYLLAGGQL